MKIFICALFQISNLCFSKFPREPITFPSHHYQPLPTCDTFFSKKSWILLKLFWFTAGCLLFHSFSLLKTSFCVTILKGECLHYYSSCKEGRTALVLLPRYDQHRQGQICCCKKARLGVSTRGTSNGNTDSCHD